MIAGGRPWQIEVLQAHVAAWNYCGFDGIDRLEALQWRSDEAHVFGKRSEILTFSKAFRRMQRWGVALLTCMSLSFLLIHAFPSAAQSTKSQESAIEKITRALSAGPPSITNGATVAEIDSEGGMKILRQGTNDFTCMPGDPTGIGAPAMCADKVAMQWNSDFEHHKAKPSTTVPGIEYMLAGATQRSDSDPFDKTSPPIPIGPHWMILWPFDPNTSGLPTTHRPTGAYIMWAGTPWAHVHIMGAP